MSKHKHIIRNIIKLGVFLTLSVFAFLSYTYFTQAQIPNFVNYQGRLRDNTGNPITAPTTIQFSLYSHIINGTPSDVPGAAGPLLWTETYDGAGGCAQITPGADGIFAQHLGDCVSFPSYLDFTQEYYLGVKIGTDPEASPRVPLSTHPYAFTAKRLNVRDENIYITSENSGDIVLQAADDILLYDTNNDLGLAGEILSSTGSGVDWISPSSFSAGSLWDLDHDTGVQIEEGADDDTLRIDTAGSQRMAIDNTGNLLLSDTEPASFINPGSLQGLLFRDDKFALRVGEATAGTEWNDVNIGNGTFASGEDNVVSGWYSAAFGGNNNINDSYSTAMGRNNTIASSYAVAGGFQNTASGYASAVFGQTNQVTDRRAMAWGLDNIASQDEATAWGRNTRASANYATSWGRDTQASGNYSTAFGYQNTASQDYGLAFGYQNTVSGRYATGWGGQNTVSGQYGTAWGSHNTASGAHSTVFGFYSEASAENGTAIGDSLANSNYMTAIGRFNENVAGQSLTNWVDTDQLFVIGNGSGWQDANRSNALTILKNGTITAPTFSIAEINTAGNTALTTKEYVDGAITAGANNIYNNDGTIAAHRTITFDDNVLDFNAHGDNSEYNLNMSDTGNLSSYFSMLPGEMEFNSDSGIGNASSNMVIGFDNFGFHHENGSGNTTELIVGDNITITDGINNRGAIYAADYSANYTNRTLVDKEYVDDTLALAIAPGTQNHIPKYNAAGTGIEESAIVIDASNNLVMGGMNRKISWNSLESITKTSSGAGGTVIRFSNSLNTANGNTEGGFEFTDHLGTNVMKITDYKVGVGTKNPLSILHANSGYTNDIPIFTLENTAGDIQMFRTDATPESSVTGSIGDFAFDGTSGQAYIKNSGNVTNTGWLRMLNVADNILLSDADSDTFLWAESALNADEDYLVAQANHTGTGTLQEWRDGGGTTRLTVNGNGDLTTDGAIRLGASEYATISRTNGVGAFIKPIRYSALDSAGGWLAGHQFEINGTPIIMIPENGNVVLDDIDISAANNSRADSKLYVGAGAGTKPLHLYGDTPAVGSGPELNFGTWYEGGRPRYSARMRAVRVDNTYRTNMIIGTSDSAQNNIIDFAYFMHNQRLGLGNSTPSSILHVDSNDANTSAILTMENTAGDIQMFRTDATPESSVTGSIGDFAFDGTSGQAYIKNSGNATNTGWLRMLNIADNIMLADTDSDTFIRAESALNADEDYLVAQANQTGNNVLQEWRDGTGLRIAALDADGDMHLGVTTYPSSSKLYFGHDFFNIGSYNNGRDFEFYSPNIGGGGNYEFRFRYGNGGGNLNISPDGSDIELNAESNKIVFTTPYDPSLTGLSEKAPQFNPKGNGYYDTSCSH